MKSKESLQIYADFALLLTGEAQELHSEISRKSWKSLESFKLIMFFKKISKIQRTKGMSSIRTAESISFGSASSAVAGNAP